MGYTVWYEGKGSVPLTDDQRAMIAEKAAACTEELSETAEDFSWTIDESGCKLSGWTKPGIDDGDVESDVDTIIDAVRELHELLPDFEFTVTDDFESELYP